MKIYLSAQWSRRDEIEGYGKLLQEDGHEVVSRWHQGEPMGNDAATNPDHWKEWANADFEDIITAKLYVAFTEDVGTMSRGGRHVEWGFALAMVDRCVVVGPIESQFYALRDARAADFDTLRRMLKHPSWATR